ncbi:unnamed protein product [Chrysoparadoxa australica]
MRSLAEEEGPAGEGDTPSLAQGKLLAKHVRTLEVLHALQRQNAKLQLETRQWQGEKSAFGDKVAGLEDELVKQHIAAEANAKLMVSRAEEAKDAVISELGGEIEGLQQGLAGKGQEGDGLKAENAELHEKVTGLVAEMKALEREMDVQLTIAAESSQSKRVAEELRRSLAAEEATSAELREELRARNEALQSRDKDLTVATEAQNRLLRDLEKATKEKERAAAEGSRSKEMQKELDSRRRANEALGRELKALEGRLVRQEEAYQALQDELRKRAEQAARVMAKLKDEQSTSKTLRAEMAAALGDERQRYTTICNQHTQERTGLLNKIADLTAELAQLRETMEGGKNRFGRYVHVKKENNQLKSKIEELKHQLAPVAGVPGGARRPSMPTYRSSNSVPIDQRLRSSSISAGPAAPIKAEGAGAGSRTTSASDKDSLDGLLVSKGDKEAEHPGSKLGIGERRPSAIAAATIRQRARKSSQVF